MAFSKLHHLAVFGFVLNSVLPATIAAAAQRSLQDCPTDMPEAGSGCGATERRCNFDAGNCPVWDDGSKQCVDNQLQAFCLCSEDETWQCAMPGCLPCSDCKDPYMEVVDTLDPCFTQGQVCPYKAGLCEEWNGQECVLEPVLSQCTCSANGEWDCDAIIQGCPACPPQPPPGDISACPRVFLTDDDVGESCDTTGLLCPYVNGTCNVWNGQECTTAENVGVCKCGADQTWESCQARSCRPCPPPERPKCPDAPITDGGLASNNTCDAVGLKCPYHAGTCNVWDGQVCTAIDNIGLCECGEDNTWSSCQARTCPTCPPDPSVCPEPYLTREDVATGCSAEGAVCKYLSGTCEVWNADSMECEPQEASARCSCDGTNWTCAEVRCPSCEPPMPSTCPLPFLTDADLTAPCATNGEKCPSMLGTCNVWNGEECIERDNVGTCVCEDSIWASCAARECPQCPPPPSSCPDPYLAHDDVRLGCSIQGETCPYLSGTCDVWNGQECVPKDLVTKCSCDGNQWICAVAICAKCEPPGGPSVCPLPYLKDEDLNSGCAVDGIDCPYLYNGCQVWDGQQCVANDLVTSCTCGDGIWRCAVPDCPPCVPFESTCPDNTPLTGAEIDEPCPNNGESCPFLAGTCDVWDGTTCTPKNVTTHCICDNNQWTCALPGCAPCPPPTDVRPSDCPKPYLAGEDNGAACSVDGATCPYKHGSCPFMDGDKCTERHIMSTCMCNGGVWNCALVKPVCDDCVPESSNTHKEEIIKGLQQVLNGIASLTPADIISFEQAMEDFVATFFAGVDSGVSNLVTTVDVTNHSVVSTPSGRRLESSIVIQYDQSVSYDSPSGIDTEVIATKPFKEDAGRADFVVLLQQKSSGLASVTSASEIVLLSTGEDTVSVPIAPSAPSPQSSPTAPVAPTPTTASSSPTVQTTGTSGAPSLVAQLRVAVVSSLLLLFHG